MWAEGVGKEEVGTDAFLLHFPKIGLHLKELEWNCTVQTITRKETEDNLVQ